MDQTCAIKTESNTCELNSATDPDTFDEATSLDGSGRNNAISLTANSELGRAFCFGTFRLLSTQRLLLNGDRDRDFAWTTTAQICFVRYLPDL